METNDTMKRGLDITEDGQQASGQSIAWALAAIVLNAMTQPSFFGYLWNGDLFAGSVWPHRSSPVITMLDGVAELWMLAENHRSSRVPNSNPDRDMVVAVKPSNVAMKLTIFVMAVLPQAIKIFSMRGIPMTQLVAAMFLVPSLISMARVLHVDAPHKDILGLVARVEANEKTARLSAIIVFLSWSAHGVGLFLLWMEISSVARITTTENVMNTTQLVSLALTDILILYVLQHVVLTILGIRLRIPRSPIAIILLFTNNLGILDIMTSSEARSKVPYHDLTFASTTLWSMALCSYGVAYTLKKFAEVLLAWTRPVGIPPDDTYDANISTGIETTSGFSDTTPQTSSTAHQEATVASVLSSISTPNPQAPVTSSSHSSPAALSPNLQNVAPESATTHTVPEDNSSEVTPDSNAHGMLTSVNEIPTQQPGASIVDLPTQNSNDVTHNSEDEGTSSDTGFSFPSNILFWVLATPVLIVLFLMIYAGIWDPTGSGDDEATQQQSAAEEGVVVQGTDERAPDDRTPTSARLVRSCSLFVNRHPFLQRSLSALNRMLQFIVRWILLSMGRLVIGSMSLYVYTFNWIIHKFQSQPKDTMVVAFAILNFVTAAVYYLTVFEAAGTYTPGWTTILG